MPFDASTVAPAAKARLIELGGEFGSDDTLGQADLTLNALSTHGAALGAHGFGAPQVTLLTDVRDAVLAAGVSRREARAEKKETNAALLDAQFAGKTARFSARAGLSSARLVLELAGNADAVRAIDAVMATTRVAGADAKVLSKQLMQLAGVLANPDIRAAVPGAEALETSLTTRAGAIDIARAAKKAPYGTPAATEHLDLLDGLIVELVRAARRAARAASRELGQPAIATAFELDRLYQSTGRRAPDDDEPAPAA